MYLGSCVSALLSRKMSNLSLVRPAVVGLNGGCRRFAFRLLTCVYGNRLGCTGTSADNVV